MRQGKLLLFASMGVVTLSAPALSQTAEGTTAPSAQSNLTLYGTASPVTAGAFSGTLNGSGSLNSTLNAASVAIGSASSALAGAGATTAAGGAAGTATGQLATQARGSGAAGAAASNGGTGTASGWLGERSMGCDAVTDGQRLCAVTGALNPLPTG